MYKFLDDVTTNDVFDDSGECTPQTPYSSKSYVDAVPNPRLSAIDAQYEELVKDYKSKITPCIIEFFSSGDIDDLMRTFGWSSSHVIPTPPSPSASPTSSPSSSSSLETSEFGHELVKRIINMSYDRTARERELVSRFLSEANLRKNQKEEKILDSIMIEKGFLCLFESIYVDGIEMDNPGATDMLSKFLARAVIDEIVCPNFLNDQETVRLGGDVVSNAKALLSRDLAPVVLELCWGPGDGRSVSDLKSSIRDLVNEYLLSYDIEEATRCVRELQSPYFLHELVKSAVTSTIDESAEKQNKISDFFTHLSINDVLTKVQASQGFDRLFGRIKDMKLDSPSAPLILDQFVERAKLNNVILGTYVPKEVPVEHNYDDEEEDDA
jgi:hypothetical protein